MDEIVAIIPARSGSKGISDKNIRLLAGKPLLAYSIAASRLAGNLDRIIVSTDSQRYANIAREYGAEVPFLRPAEISYDMSTDYQFIKHTLDWFKDNEGRQPKYLVHLRPTTPLRNPRCIEAAIEMIMNNSKATALRSVHEMSESAYKMMEIEERYLKCVCSGSFNLDEANNPRQRFNKTYSPNGYIDIIVSSYVMENHKIHGDQVLAYVTEHVVEVDTIDDFDYLEYKVASNSLLFDRLFT
jgi:CMP-N,N'-diacetyllegionaminic acid synthase